MKKLTKRHKEKLGKYLKVNIENLSDKQLINKFNKKAEEEFIKKLTKDIKKINLRLTKKIVRMMERG